MDPEATYNDIDVIADDNTDDVAGSQDKPPTISNRDAAAEDIIGLSAKTGTGMAHGAINNAVV
jgi:hypothetical protein